MVKIVGDTTSALSADFAEQHGIPIVPQVINFGDASYLEGVEIDYDTFMHKLQNADDLPKTAAPPPDLFTEVFERLAPDGESIICILPSAEVSGTVRSAVVGRQIALERGLAELDVRIIDTRLIAGPVASLLEVAAEWAEQGCDADTIEARVREMSQRAKIYFSVATLKYLAKGGRIGGAAALLGSVLKVKPVLTFTDGQVDTFEKVRTHKRAVDRLKELVGGQISRAGDGYLSIMHAAALEEAEELAAELGHKLALSRVAIRTMPPAVVTHGGPGILGVGFFMERGI